jgi:ABC-type transport system substrate-binding protein
MVQNHLHPTRPGWNPEWEKNFPAAYGYNPEKAKQLLAEAGYGPGGKPLEITFYALPLAQYSGAEEVAEAVAGYWKKVGVNVTLATIDAAELQAQTRDMKFSSAASMSATSSAELIGTTAYTSSLPPRGGGTEDPEVDRLLIELKKTMNEGQQDELWRKIGDAMFGKYMDVPLFWLPAEAFVDPKVVADWTFPGSISGTWTHPEYIKAAR